MRRATTPTITIDINEDLTDCWFRIIFDQRLGPKIIKTNEDESCTLSDDGKSIDITLTQEETLKFDSRYPIDVQIRFGKDEHVGATNIAKLKIRDILDEEVVQFERTD